MDRHQRNNASSLLTSADQGKKKLSDLYNPDQSQSYFKGYKNIKLYKVTDANWFDSTVTSAKRGELQNDRFSNNLTEKKGAFSSSISAVNKQSFFQNDMIASTDMETGAGTSLFQ